MMLTNNFGSDGLLNMAEVTQGLDVNLKVLHRWRREFRQGLATGFQMI
jgi:hypothetical protein